MALAIFDLDNTLIAGDSDYEWGEFLVEKGVVDPVEYKDKNNYFYEEYKKGTLDIYEFLTFVFKPLSEHSMEILNQWHKEFMADRITPIMLSRSKALLQKHRDQGDTLLIITATNSFITGPICHQLGVDDFIASEPEKVDGRFTGRVHGTPTYREGKITRLREWLKDKDIQLQGSYGYSDSINDLPLLELVDNPVVVDGDPQLLAEAEQRQWPCISLRD